MKVPIAIATSDWHLWANPPIFRSEEENWLRCMSIPIREMKKKQRELGVPILFAGDLFDYYNPPPYLLNWFLKQVPKDFYVIPGQHDLKNHLWSKICFGGIETIVRAGKAVLLDPETITEYSCNGVNVQVVSSPWKVKENEFNLDSDSVKILVCHEYIWSEKSNCFNGADQEANVQKKTDRFDPFDFAIFGDNHIPWSQKVNGCQVCNCGTMIRRKRDEKDLDTGFFVLYSDGSCDRVPFSREGEVYTESQIVEVSEEEKASLLAGLEEVCLESIDFEDLVFRSCEDQEELVEIFTNVFEKVKGKK